MFGIIISLSESRWIATILQKVVTIWMHWSLIASNPNMLFLDSHVIGGIDQHFQ